MFDINRVSILNVPRWEAVYRAEICPGIVSIVAIHDTTRGRALGGCRILTYENESAALTDVLRLSRGMTFKNAIADLPLGGGKALIMCDPEIAGEERERMLLEFGKFVDAVNGDRERYITAEDMNTTVSDMLVVKRTTRHISGIEVDPSPYTAWGVYCAVKSATRFFADDLFGGNGDLRGKRILIQGIGKVGHTMAEHLDKAGAELFVSDINPSSIDRLLTEVPSANVVAPDKVIDQEVDIFVPCAGGEVVTKYNIDNVKFKILCGAANNQLATTPIGARLQERGIVYCPDYIANMGGVCSIQYLEIERLSEEETLERIANTVDQRLKLTFETGFANNLSFNEAVDHAVKELIWGNKESTLTAHNRDLFPGACAN
ncbi:MAG: Glu/Leu/Phe/Val dehydrogenase dimerization domain-containing protein [Acidobacteriota bacterium]|nr:Glu/Leu/Phe/Val dehydrogenase dimerization domain-containing protein [Acidobacteriota bacterium]